MKIKEIKYRKKDGEEIKDYNLLVLKEDKEYIAGIDLNKLNEEETAKIKSIQEEYEEKLKPFMKAYRNFIVENIQ